MSFIKKFHWTKENNWIGIELSTMDDFNEYVQGKVDFFKITNNYCDKETMLSLFSEINDMCKFDFQNAIFDNTNVESVKGFNIESNKKTIIYCYNYILILGTIFYNVFDCPGNRLIRVEDGYHGAIFTREMLVQAYNELLASKNCTGKSAYGATLIFATLIEEELKSKVKNIYMVEAIEKLNVLVCNKTTTLLEDELQLLNYLNNKFITYNPQDMSFDIVAATTTLSYELFRKYSVIDTGGQLKMLMTNDVHFTFNKFISSNILKTKTDTRFVDMLKNLFNFNKINLRNNLAHCSFGHINYYNISGTALLFVIGKMISDDMFLR